MFSFRLSHLGTRSTDVYARLGQLTRPSKPPIDTPHYVATTSRGVVPHVSQDTLRNHTAISSIYLGLEDFIEKPIACAPAFKTPATCDESPIRSYIAAHESLLTVLGPRRVRPLHAPTHNTNSTISICTSVGFRQLDVEEYYHAIEALRPDVAITIADIVTAIPAGAKRMQKSADRTHEWLTRALESAPFRGGPYGKPESKTTALFAAIPPVDNALQLLDLQELAERGPELLSGVALYSSRSIRDLPPPLSDLSRLCISDPSSPHAILNDILLGVDLITTPFLTAASEQGLAMDFKFSDLDSRIHARLPLGHDLWSNENQACLQPLAPNCRCFTCTNHHRAYLHHLLQAKEMLAWTLLQIHNHAVMDEFFGAVRRSIGKGTIQEDVDAFNGKYEAELPKATGVGPRVRGYQFKSVGGGESRKNEKSWGRLDDTIQKVAEAESVSALPEGHSGELEKAGFAMPVRETLDEKAER